MTTHSSILAWEILWTADPGERQFMGLQELYMTVDLKSSHNLKVESYVLFGGNF